MLATGPNSTIVVMTKQSPSLQRLLDLHSLLLQLQQVKRIVHLPDNHEQENDTEHSYNLAIAAWFLVQYFPKLNKDRVIRFALVHDLVEVYAGDTYIYAEQSIVDGKKEREKAALKRLEKEWPDFSEMVKLIKAYEAKTSEEARFVYALDKIMPILLIFLGEGYTWQKEGIGLEQLHNVKKNKVALSPEIDRYYQELYSLLQKNTHLFPDRATS